MDTAVTRINCSRDLSVGLFEIKGLCQLDELKTNSRQEISAISAETLVNATENAAKRALLDMQNEGGHLKISY